MIASLLIANRGEVAYRGCTSRAAVRFIQDVAAMANGRPGDHPYTDIVVHGASSEFGEEISGLVRALAAAPGFSAVRDEVAGLLETISFAPRPDDWDAATAELLSRLREIEARLARRDFGLP